MKKGFTLLEILLYVAILATVSGLFVGILLTTTRVQLSETASNEVNNQLNFTLQTIQRLVRNSSNIETVGADNSETTTVELVYLKLRMDDSALDPTCISQVGNTIRVSEGPQTQSPNDGKCKNTDTTDDITTNKVLAPNNPSPGLEIVKYSNPQGHDSVQIDLTLNYSTTNPQSAFSRKLQTAVGRVSAATFDSHLVPNQTNSIDIGQTANRWKDAYFSGDVDVQGNFKVGPGYLQFTKSGSGDPTSDCSSSADAGKFYLRTSSPFKLFVCVNNAWKFVTLN